MEIKIGDRIRIIHMDDPYALHYDGQEGVVVYIDDAGQVHGTWGGAAIIPELDEFEIIG